MELSRIRKVPIGQSNRVSSTFSREKFFRYQGWFVINIALRWWRNSLDVRWSVGSFSGEKISLSSVVWVNGNTSRRNANVSVKGVFVQEISRRIFLMADFSWAMCVNMLSPSSFAIFWANWILAYVYIRSKR